MHLNHQGMSFRKCSLWNWVSLHPNGQWWNQLLKKAPYFVAGMHKGSMNTYSITRSLWNELKRSRENSLHVHIILTWAGVPLLVPSTAFVSSENLRHPLVFFFFFFPHGWQQCPFTHTIYKIDLIPHFPPPSLLFSEGKQRQRWLLSAFLLILTPGTRRPSTPPSLWLRCHPLLCWEAL